MVQYREHFMLANKTILALVSVAAVAAASGCAWSQRNGDDAASVMLDHAKSLYDAGRYSKAESAFSKLDNSRAYAAEIVEEAVFYMGECRFERGDYPGAHKIYSRLLKDFRRSTHTDAVVEREFIIGAAFCTGRQTAFLRKRGFGAKVLLGVLEYHPFSVYSAEARLILGDYYLDQADYDEAIVQYDVLIRDFGSTSLARIAKYRKALCLYHNLQGNRYNIEETEKAIESLQLAHKELSQPARKDAQSLEDIDSKLHDLREVGARENYDIGRFFLKNRNKKAAATYFYAVLKEAPNSSYAEPARKALDRIEREINQ